MGWRQGTRPCHLRPQAAGAHTEGRNRMSEARTALARPRSPHGVAVGSVSGFDISLDYSWFVIFFLILGTFTGAVFPAYVPGLSQRTYLAMGLAGAVLFFLSLLAHEL